MIYKKYSTLIIIISLGLFLFSGNISALEIEKEDNVRISNLHVIEDDLIAIADNITIDGEIEGDFIGIAAKITTNGKVRNSVSVLCENYTHSGKIEGSVRIGAKSIQINGKIGRSLLAFCFADFQLGSKGSIGNDAIIESNIINIDGTIYGKTKLTAEKVYITGIIENDIEIEADEIQILAPALIKGDLTYTSSKQATIDISSGVTIVGDTKWNLPKDINGDSQKSFTGIVQNIAELLAVFLFGIILFSFSGKYISETMNQLTNNFGITTAVGFLSTIVFIISLVILIVSLILMIVGATLISSNNAVIGATILAISTLLLPITSFITVSGGILLYSGKIVIALLIAFHITKLTKSKTKIIGKTKLLIGLVILFALFTVPYLGNLVKILVAIVGAGGIILGIKNCRHENGKNTIPPIEFQA